MPPYYLLLLSISYTHHSGPKEREDCDIAGDVVIGVGAGSWSENQCGAGSEVCSPYAYASRIFHSASICQDFLTHALGAGLGVCGVRGEEERTG